MIFLPLLDAACTFYFHSYWNVTWS